MPEKAAAAAPRSVHGTGPPCSRCYADAGQREVPRPVEEALTARPDRAGTSDSPPSTRKTEPQARQVEPEPATVQRDRQLVASSGAA